MITDNLSTLKIHKLTQSQYDNAVSSGTVNENELYLTPYEEIDLTPYATIEQLNEKASASDVVDLKDKVGNTSVSEQITTALSNFSSGKTLTEHLTEEDLVLVLGKHYGNILPDPGTPGRIFFLKVSE